MSSGHLWITAFHIVFVAGWFAGLGVVGYHHACRSLLRNFEQFGRHRSHRWFRVFNEASVLLFAVTVVRVVVKPSF